MDDLKLIPLLLTLGFACGLIVWMFLNSLQQVQEEAEEQPEVYSQGFLFQLSLPLLQFLGRRLEERGALPAFQARIQKKLTLAGKQLAISPGEFLGWMLVWGLIGAAVAIYFQLMIGITPSIALLLVLLCTFIPFMNLNEQVIRRQKKIRKILPYVLDLLCLAVEAGLDFTAALNRIGESLKENPLRDELRLLSRDLNMGKTRPEALREMERRIGLEELTGVVSSLIQADELGASLGTALRIQSQELQRVRFQRAEKKAMQAPVLMLIPLVLFIFPLVFLMIFTPIVIQIMDKM